MKHTHHHDDIRGAGHQLKRVRAESTQPNARVVFIGRTFDNSQPEVKTQLPTGNGQALEMVSDQQRLELYKATEQNKTVLNPIQSSWPTPSE